MIPEKVFGKTGHVSKRVIFGAAAFMQVTQKEADETLDLLLKYDINHLDVAASYGDAELRLGPWMPKHRDKFFLATKTEMRTYSEARAELETSLKRLQTDSVDLWQMHVLINPEEWEIAMGQDGALKAFIEAKEEGLVKHLGVTGHGVNTPAMHMKSLERYDFDSVLLPYNYVMMQNPKYAGDFKKLEQICLLKDIAIQTIKSLARGPLGEQKKVRAVWYDPLENESAITNSVHWVLGNENVFLNTVGDIHLLPKVLEAADKFKERPDDEIMQSDLDSNEITPLFTENSSP